jgi:hypothetical protein
MVVNSDHVFFSGEGQNFTLSWGGATTTTGVYISSKSSDTVIE